MASAAPPRHLQRQGCSVRRAASPDAACCERFQATSVQGNSVCSAVYNHDGNRGRQASYRPVRLYQSGWGKP